MNRDATIQRTVVRLILIAAASVFALGCSKDLGPKFSLVWADEFTGPAGQLPDSTKWTYDVGTGWGNAQLEYDTDHRPQNVSLDGAGHLAITAIQESYNGQGYTSGRITTRGLFQPTYGRIEARIQLPSGQGLWPAFWLLGANYPAVGWPQCGEIDVMENVGSQPSWIFGSLHGPGYSGGNAVTQRYGLVNDRFDTGFHVFAVEWDPDHIDWSVDGVSYQRATSGGVSGPWVFDHPFAIILNLAVGGTFPGAPGAGTTFPQAMLVDWVHVYGETN